MKKTYSALPSMKERFSRYATASTSYQILNPDISHWTQSKTLLGFKKAFGWTIVAGEPVGPLVEQAAAMTAFEASHPPVAYFAAEEGFYHRFRDSHPHTVYLGSQPVWTPENWQAAMRHPSLRYQCHRAKNKGICVSEMSASAVRANTTFATLRQTWLAQHGLPPMHFLVETDVLASPGSRRFIGATQGNQLVGMLVLAPISGRSGYLVEVAMRHPNAPNGTVEYMLDQVFCSISDIQMLTLGLSPLRPSPWQSRNPRWIRIFFAMLRCFGSPFYDFMGVNRFKEKCRPGSWEPLFLMSRHRITPQTLAAVAKIFLSV